MRIQNGTAVDEKGISEYKDLVERVAPRWRDGTFALLKEKNTKLFDQIENLESRIQSLLIIPVKPKPLLKEWATTLDDYERAMNCAIAYAERHLSRTGVIHK